MRVFGAVEKLVYQDALRKAAAELNAIMGF